MITFLGVSFFQGKINYRKVKLITERKRFQELLKKIMTLFRKTVKKLTV